MRAAKILVPFAVLLPLSVAAGCVDDDGGEEAPTPSSGKSDDPSIVDQNRSDVTVLKAEALTPIGGQGGLEPDLSQCVALDPDDLVDCTAHFEELFGAPAMHQMILSRLHEQEFFCRLLDVQTVSREGAVADSEGIGFYYKGWKPFETEPFRFVGAQDLEEVGSATLKDGSPAKLHRFIGLANCWLGSATSSSRGTYRFKPWMEFAGEDGMNYRNWDEADDYLIMTQISGFDRSAELLRTP